MIARLGIFAVLALFTLSFAQDDLKFVILLHRHGDRAPILTFPTITPAAFAQQWPLGMGELTGHGMGQLYELGTALRQTYVGPNSTNPNFLNPHFSATAYVVRSTDVHRTLQSAESLLYALFPPGTGPTDDVTPADTLPERFQPVPISTVPKLEDNLLIGWDWAMANCPTYQSGLQALMASGEWQQKAAENAALFAQLSNITGQAVSMQTITFVYDTFVCYAAHSAVLYNGAVTTQMMQQMNAVVSWIYSRLVGNPQMLRLQIAELATAIDSYLSQVATGSLATKFMHYSAHDTTVMPTLAALQLFRGDLIPYAAHIVMEVRQVAPLATGGREDSPDADSANLVVTVSYQGVLQSLPFCGNATRCPLATFQQYLRNNYDARNLDAWCGTPGPAPDDGYVMLRRGVIALSVVAVALAATLVALGVWVYRHRNSALKGFAAVSS